MLPAKESLRIEKNLKTSSELPCLLTRLIPKIAVVTDFDGTLIENDLPFLILEKFGRKGWQHYDNLLASGKISLEECITKQYLMIQTSRKSELLKYVADLWEFRKGSLQLIDFCSKQKIPFAVVSAGLDFCIRGAFKAGNQSVPKLLVPIAKSLGKDRGFAMSFPKKSSISNFKESFVLDQKRKNNFVVFIGDGIGDYPPATRADKVFTIKNSSLENLCKKNGIKHIAIENLLPVLEFVKEISLKQHNHLLKKSAQRLN